MYAFSTRGSFEHNNNVKRRDFRRPARAKNIGVYLIHGYTELKCRPVGVHPDYVQAGVNRCSGECDPVGWVPHSPEGGG